MRPAGVSMTNEAHSDMLRSDRLRADQWRVGTSVTATPGAEIDPIAANRSASAAIAGS